MKSFSKNNFEIPFPTTLSTNLFAAISSSSLEQIILLNLTLALQIDPAFLHPRILAAVFAKSLPLIYPSLKLL